MARFQIFLSTRQSDRQRALDAPGGSGRVRAFLSAVLLASVFVAFLMAALVIGSIVAVLLVTVVGVAFVVALFRWAMGRRLAPTRP